MINIIMPVYNGIEYIHTPLNSLVNLTIEKDLFILTIVQDFDGLDYTDIIKEYLDKGITINFIKADHHVTQGPARQMGIDSLPNVDYVMFLDQDDFLYKNAMKQLLKCAVGSKADIVFSAFIKETEDDEELVNQNHSDIITLLHGKLFSKKYLDEYNIRFNPNLKYAEDSTFNLIAFYSTEKKVYLNETTYYWNYNDKSQSRNNEMEYLRDMYADYIIGQLTGIMQIKNSTDLLKDELVLYIILYIYNVINIEDYKKFDNFKYIDTLKLFGSQDFVKELMNKPENKKYLASHVQGGMLFLTEPIFFLIPFDKWLDTWLEK